MIIRRVERGDIDYFVEIYIEAYRGYEEYAYTSLKDIRGYFKWLYGRDRDGFFVAEIEEPVGFSACDTNWFSSMERTKVAELHELFVRKEFRGKGIASKLMEKSVEYGIERGRRIMGLWVGEKNEPAKKFYRKHGFRESGKMGKWVRMTRMLHDQA